VVQSLSDFDYNAQNLGSRRLVEYHPTGRIVIANGQFTVPQAYRHGAMIACQNQCQDTPSCHSGPLCIFPD